MRLADRPEKRPAVLVARQDAMLVLLDPDGGEYYSLNEVGARVWDLCDGARTLADVVATICDEFEAPRELAEADVVELLDDLVAEGLVTAGPAP